MSYNGQIGASWAPDEKQDEIQVFVEQILKGKLQEVFSLAKLWKGLRAGRK